MPKFPRLLVCALLLSLAALPAAAAVEISVDPLKAGVLVGEGGQERALAPGDPFRTAGTFSVTVTESGLARLAWSDGTAALLEPSTVALAGPDTLSVKRGDTWLRFRKRAGAFRILTPSATLCIRGTAFRLRVGDSGETAVDLAEGRIEVETNGKVLPLEAGSMLRVNGPGATPFISGLVGEARAELLAQVDRLFAPEPDPADRGVDLAPASDPRIKVPEVDAKLERLLKRKKGPAPEGSGK